MKRSGMEWHGVEKSPSDEQHVLLGSVRFILLYRRGFLDYARGHKSYCFCGLLLRSK
jgi:hypothetical protein